MVAENVFVSFSGATIETGSRTAQLAILCGISGTMAIPVMVTSAGAVVTI